MTKIPFLFFFLFSFQLFSQELTEQLKQSEINADFEIDSSSKPIYQFNNKSTNAQVFHWYFYQKTSDKSKIKYVNYTSLTPLEVIKKDYRDSLGSYFVCLVAQNTYGNSDTMCKKLDSRPKMTHFRPFYSICPNCNDTSSEKSFILNFDKTKQLEQYNMKIYNRWGVLLFESNDPSIPWDGKQAGTNKYLENGVYYFVCQYKFINEEKTTYNNQIHLYLINEVKLQKQK